MPICLIFACLWGLLAGGAWAMPERSRWTMVWVLIGTGIPLLGLVTIQIGPVFGLGGLVLAVLMISRTLGATMHAPESSVGKA
jgi:hypothetical protein